MSARRALLLLAVLALVVLVARVAGPRIEGLVNRTHTAALPEVSEAARWRQDWRVYRTPRRSPATA